MPEPSLFIYFVVALSCFMLIWNSIEVGRNDAANIVNAVFGARILKRRIAVYISGCAVVLGAWASSPVMETARSGIFDPALFSAEKALSIYISVYITNSVLLYTFSSFGMPVSTTAQLVFGLLGGAYALGGTGTIHWNTSSIVILSIVVSIFVSGIFSFVFQKIFRTIIGQDMHHEQVISRHGPWIAGVLTTGLFFFMIMKGMKNVHFVKDLNAALIGQYGYVPVLIVMILVTTLLFGVFMFFMKKTMVKILFPGLAILGMICLAIAFGQNDLANCASPGVASYMIYKYGASHIKEDVPTWLLLGCGILLFAGMTTKRAQRVTRAEVNTGSQGDIVKLYAPKWCVNIAKLIVKKSEAEDHPFIPPDKLKHKAQHYDALRAAVITSVSASVIAFASGMGMPVSTTYVSFAAVIATGWSDHIFVHGDAVLKMGRTIWVVFTWFSSAFLSAFTTGICALIVFYTGTIGIICCLAANFFISRYMKSVSDTQEEKINHEAKKRKEMLLLSAGKSQTVSFASDSDEDQF